MELNTEDANSVADPASPDPSSEIARILEAAQRQLEEEFRKRLEAAVRAAETAAMGAAGSERDEAVNRARADVTAELRAQFDQTQLRTITQLQSESEKKARIAKEQWDEELQRVQGQLNQWRSYAEAQRLMAESNSQTEILSHFLQHAEAFAVNLAIYVSKPDGLALWKTRGDGPFPQLISQDTSDPDAFFKPIVVRGRTIAAVSARPPFNAAPLTFLSGCLERAIEAFGLRIQSIKARSATS